MAGQLNTSPIMRFLLPCMLLLLAARPLLVIAEPSTALPQTLQAEKHYREAAWHLFLDDPANALLTLQLAPALTLEGELLQAGLLLQLHMPKAAMARLEQLLAQGQQKGVLPQQLRNIILLQFARYQLEQGQHQAAADYLSQFLPPYADFAGQYYLLRQLLLWPDGALTRAELLSAEQHAEQPYLLSNQALMSLQLGQYALAQQQLQQLSLTLTVPGQRGFWRQLFAGQSEANVSDPVERLALQDYQQLLQAQLYIAQLQYADAQRVLSQFAKGSVLAQPAMQLYAQVLQTNRQLPALQAVLQAQIQQYPWHSGSWQAAYQLGEQFVLSQQYRLALAAHREAALFYQQRALFLSTELSLSPDIILAPPASHGWLSQQLQLPQLAVLQQQLVQHQALYQLQLQRGQRLNYLQHVLSHKLDQQQQLLASELPVLQQKVLDMQEQYQQLQALMRQADEEGMQEIFWQGERALQLVRLNRAQARLPVLQQGQHPQFEQYLQRLRLLQGLLRWHFEQDRAERRWQWKKAEQQLAAKLAQAKANVVHLSSLSGQTAALQQQQVALEQLSEQQDRQLQLLTSTEQQIMQQLTNRLQTLQQQQLALVTLWQQQNTAAIARLLEQVLLDAEVAP